MQSKDKFISQYGLLTSIVVSVMGVTIFYQAKILAKSTGTLSWVVNILSGFLIYLCAMIMYKVIHNNNYNTIDVILEDSFGKILAKIVGVLISIYGMYSISSGLRAFVEVVKVGLLPNENTELIVIILMLAGVYLIKGEIKSVVAFNEVCFWLMFIPIISMFFILKQADMTNMFPLIPDENFNLLKGINDSIFSFGGFEIMFFLLPHIKDNKGTKKSIGKAFIIITICYSVVVFLTIALFGVKQTEKLLRPSLVLIRTIKISGGFLERWEGVLMFFWVIFYYTTFTNIYYLSNYVLEKVFKLKGIRLTIPITSILVYIFAMFPQNISEVNKSEEYLITIMSYVVILVIPIILLIISYIKKNRVRVGNDEEKI